MSELKKALKLAAIGCHVHPCRPQDEPFTDRDGNHRVHPAKTGRTKHGNLDASNDPIVIRGWWKKWPDSLVGVNAGLSRLVCLDIDVDADKGVNGWHSLDAAGHLPLPETVHYKTRRGGSHYVYRAPKSVKLDQTTKHQGMEGVDRRAGSSHFVWWGDDVPKSRKAFR
jgi:hypothetical protein